MKCWWAQPSSHDGSVHAHSRAKSVRGRSRLLPVGFVASWVFGDTDVQNQLAGIVRNKAIYQKVATAMVELSYSRTWHRAKLPVAKHHEHRHENEIHIFFAVSDDSHMNRSRTHAFT